MMLRPPPTRAVWSVDRRLGFTLIELLVVVGVIVLLLAIMLPAQSRARVRARITIAHADLRNVCLALDGYMLECNDHLPPARRACGTNVNFQLPVELAQFEYLPKAASSIPQAEFMDTFRPEHTYKYLAPGGVYQNGTFFDFPDPEQAWRPRSEIWVPEDFPRCESTEGARLSNRTDEPPCPVVYSVWSIGPDPLSSKFPRTPGGDMDAVDETMFPLPRRFWLEDSGDTGLITHFRTREGHTHSSP